MSTDATLAILLGAAVGGSVALLVLALRGTEPSSSRPAGIGGVQALSLTRVTELFRRRATPAIIVGVVAAALTRWPVAALAGAALALFWPSLFGGGKASKAGADQLEALASWTESLRDTIAGAAGLEAAIPASVATCGAAIREPVSRLSDRLRSREPMVDALRRFGDDLDDASADLIVAALVLNARLRGAGLVTVLGELSRSAREELDMRRRVDAGRRSTRRGVQVIVVVTIGVALMLVVFNRSYVEPFGTTTGQLVLAGIVGIFGFAFWWLRRLSEFNEPARFLLGAPASEAGLPSPTRSAANVGESLAPPVRNPA